MTTGSTGYPPNIVQSQPRRRSCNGEATVDRVAAIHRVTYTLDLMRAIREALADGFFASLRATVAGHYERAESRPVSHQ